MLGLAASANGGVIPTQGLLIKVGTPITGQCSTQAPFPNSSTWGTEHNGTPYSSQDTGSDFLFLGYGSPSPEATYAQRSYVGPGPSLVLKCAFGNPDAHGNPVTELPVRTVGPWLMKVTTTYHVKRFDSVTGWASAPGDGRTVTHDVPFDVGMGNPCNSPWAGRASVAPACLKQKQKKEAAQAARDYGDAHRRDQESYSGLGCGPGASNFDGKEVALACAAVAAKNIVDGQLEMQEQLIANDPPDPHFAHVAKPATPVVRGLSRMPHRLPKLAALLRNELEIVGLDAALVTSINRANGAFVSGSNTAVKRQNAAAQSDAKKVTQLLTQQHALLVAARGELAGRRLLHNLLGGSSLSDAAGLSRAALTGLTH